MVKNIWKKHCHFCNAAINHLDHKDVELLSKFIAYNGKIKPRRLSGLCTKHQRLVSNAIKKARIIGLLPFIRDEFETEKKDKNTAKKTTTVKKVTKK